ncbi:tRNA pseudouridine synthase B [Desulfosarcina widdelii]|uniref:tRNA pseudouridine synthase B n=1 Tax=Desulfosarcina widdelii TaxID=947919 RepID=A0A5K7Z622_9BACT|nr:tRNA pseudouridine(55) synthase TruB [Desulfosarcina widdelii]BBO76458.1 tRNA pseudouridine synthase B [Desulfosarcina widdelii]
MPSELNGIVVVDKPDGLSSARVVSRIKALFGARKTGHTGTLDPFATGVLVCCLNRATRLSRFFLKGDKTYEAVLRLGIQTDTQDPTGAVVAEQPVEGITDTTITRIAGRFIGEIAQVPPVYSALKHEGTPLYKLARRGEAIEKPARMVRIDRLDILEVNLPEVRFRVSCSSGTYIRTLCADMGDALGCGGHLKRLRRTVSCGFSIEDALNPEALAALKDRGMLEKAVIGMNDALPFIPAVVADDGLAGKVANGMKLSKEDFPSSPARSREGFFKIVDRSGRLIAVLGDSGYPDSYNYCCVFAA